MYTELNRIIPTTIVYIAHRYNVEHFVLFFLFITTSCHSQFSATIFTQTTTIAYLFIKGVTSTPDCYVKIGGFYVFFR